MDDLNLGKNLSSLKLVNFVGEVIGCSICLNSQLKLSNYLIVNNNLQSDITDRNLFYESVFDLL